MLRALRRVRRWAGIAAGDFSSVDVTQAHLDRIEAVDPAVHAFLHADGERALATAARVDVVASNGYIHAALIDALRGLDQEA